MNLSELIKTHKGDRSYEALSEDCGGSPRAARLQQLATQPQKNFPDPETMEALALGLRVPAITVVLSAAESFGVDVRRALPALLDRLPVGVERLDENQIQVLVDVARTFVQVNEASDLQTVILQNLMLDSGVKIVDKDRVELHRSDAMPTMLKHLIEAERREPGRVNEFYIELSSAIEGAAEHGAGRYGVEVIVGETWRDSLSVDVYPLPDGVRIVGGLFLKDQAARGDESGGPQNQSTKP